MVFWKRELRDLATSQRRFEDIFRIFTGEFTDTPFSEQYRAGRTVRMSYAELAELTNRIARVLHARFSGKEGAFLALKMENSPLWVAAFFGILQAGFRPLLLNLRLDEQTLREVTADAQAAAVLTDHPEEGCFDLSGCGDAPAFSPCWADEIALLTSGTTGRSKLIVYSGAAICEQLLQTTDIVRRSPEIKHDRLARGIRILAFLPFYHIFGLCATLLWFVFFGTTFVFLESLDAKNIQFTCKYGRLTHFFAIPTVWDMTARQIVRTAEKQGQLETLRRAVRLSNRIQSALPHFGTWLARKVLFKKVRAQALGTELMYCISGGGFIRPETLELMNGLGYGLRNGYGMTETGILSVELSNRASRRNSGTVGLPLSAVGSGSRISPEGLLEVRAPLLYTAQIVDGVRIERDPAAWFTTGDCFRVDKTGRWYITGRRGDLIIGANGENLSPDLIEQRLDLHAGLASCVFGMEVEGDERPVLLIQVPSVDDAYACASAAQAAYDAIDTLPLTLRPARVYCTQQEIPQNLGKTRRAVLKERIASGEVTLVPAQKPDGAQLAALEDESLRALTQELCGVIREVTGAETVAPDTHVLHDLGVDSMTYYAIFSAVSEHCGVALAMDAARPLFTPRDFAAEVLRERSAQA